jgi:energy-coupling factor transporter ATP-binding protein EcfA2
LRSVLEIEDYSFTYSGVSRPALLNINLKVECKEIVVIAGPSGCGKSTLLRSINGLIPHMYAGTSVGTVVVEGSDVSKTPISELSKKVGYVFQNPENQIFMFTVERDVAFGLENLGLPRDEIRQRIDWAMDLIGIRDLAYRPPHELSDGQKQRVAIAGVLAMKPQVLILDEPTSLLDPYTASELINTVKDLRDQLGITILVVEHRLDLLAKIATRIVVMNKGSIVLDGEPKKVLPEKEALLVGISVPVTVRLHTLLSEEGVNLGSLTLSADDLAKTINGISHD